MRSVNNFLRTCVKALLVPMYYKINKACNSPPLGYRPEVTKVSNYAYIKQYFFNEQFMFLNKQT